VTSPQTLRIALNGWFGGQSVGSGQYTDRLAAALTPLLGSGLRVMPPRHTGAWAKLAFEQWGFPRAARGSDVAHVPYWAPPLRPSVPTVVTVHDLIPLVLPAYRQRGDVRAYVTLVARATLRAAAVVADSAHTARDVVGRLGIPSGRVHVIPLGVDRPTVTPADVARVRQHHHLPDRYALYLGGFDERKNLVTLLGAWRAVHAATGVPLVVAGRLPGAGDRLCPQVPDLARRLGLPDGAWQACGPVAESDKAALYAGAAVFAYPSRYEGFGLPPLEAMAAGCPVVAADATSLPEVVADAGLLVSPDDPAAWAEALRRVLEDDAVAARLRGAGPARAAQFTWARTAAATLAVYRSVAAEGRP
jgi:glycosyltransferase involved in cell wall biosynthesis